MRLNKYIDPFMYIVLVAELLVFVYIAYYAQKEVRVMIKQRLKYFKVGGITTFLRCPFTKVTTGRVSFLQPFWNKVEALMILLCFCALIMFFYRIISGSQKQQEVADAPNEYHNFQHVVVWDNVSFRRPLHFEVC